jgi:hypothetical protein
LIDAEDWSPDDRPRAAAYFCGTLAAPPPGDGPSDPGFAQRPRDAVRARAVRFLSEDVDRLLPGARRDGAFRWDLLCGSGGTTGPAAFDIQYWVANVDTSDRYVQSLTGTDGYRLRPDESGYANLYLARDWTDCGLNADASERPSCPGSRAPTPCPDAHADIGSPATTGCDDAPRASDLVQVPGDRSYAASESRTSRCHPRTSASAT